MASFSQAITQATTRKLSVDTLCTSLEFKRASIVHPAKIPFRNTCRTFQSSFQLLISVAPRSSRWQSDVNDDRHLQNCVSGCWKCPVTAHASSTSTDSPFTEKYSLKKSHGKGLVSKFSFRSQEKTGEEIEGDNFHNSIPARSSHEANLAELIRESSSRGQEGSNSTDPSEQASQLPELREVLTLLKRRWEEEAAIGERRRGPGSVFLVGTGPGDPELLTVKALRLMQSADLVLYDRLVSTDILDLVHASARLLYVGKTAGFHSRTQEEIHELLLNFAEAGATVVRLKGGDPLVFGRGGEEMDFLQDQGIQVKVVPGITAASGIAAELGIPLTHRGAANSVKFLTGHSRKGGDDPLYVAEQAADPDSTLVIYMGLATLPALAAKLMAHGLSPDTPAAAVERGTTPQQRMEVFPYVLYSARDQKVFSTLASLPEQVSRAKLVSPTLIFIGRVVALSPLWPSDAVTDEATTEQSFFLHNSTISSPAGVQGRSEKLQKEPRDRRQRSPDPALPSQQ